jgi:hypothetical protein
LVWSALEVGGGAERGDNGPRFMARQALERAGVVDLSFQTPGSEDPGELMEALELFGKKVLPHIRDV